MSTIEENRKAYEGSGLQALMEANGHEICDRCYCCDAVYELVNCWACGGFPFGEGDEYDTGCRECDGDGQISVKTCLGRCNEKGEHETSAAKGGAADER